VACEKLAAFLQPAPALEEQIVGLVLLFPMVHLRADALARAKDFAVSRDPAPERAPVADQGLMADLGQTLGAAMIPACDQEAGSGVGELAHDLGHRRLVRDGGTGAGVLLALARGHEAYEKAARRLPFLVVQPPVDLLGPGADRARDPTDSVVRSEGEDTWGAAVLPRLARGFPGLAQRVLQQRQLALVLANLVQDALDQIAFEGEADGRRRFLDALPDLVAGHRAEVELLALNRRRQRRVPQEGVIEVGADSQDHGQRAVLLAGRGQQQIDEPRDVGAAVSRRLPGSLGSSRERIQLLPLVDIEEQTVGAGLLVQMVPDQLVEPNRAAQQAVGIGIDLLDPFGRRGAIGRRREHRRERVQGLLARTDCQHVPGDAMGALAQRREQAGVDQGRLPAARAADHRDQRVHPGFAVRSAIQSSRPKKNAASSSRNGSRPR
jgi:hypothetical protein